MRRLRRLDLQAKISLVLVAVILPIFAIVTLAENKLARPILEEEMRQVGLNSGKTLAAEILSQHLLTASNPTLQVENHLQEFLYSQPNIVRIDVVTKDTKTGSPKIIASTVEEEPGAIPLVVPLVETATTELKADEVGDQGWDISVPIEQKSRDPRGPKRILGTVHLVVSMKFIQHFLHTLWRTTAQAAAFSVVTLILVLSYFLRKTITNDRKLKQAETQNLQLTEQLHDAQRQLMNTEKLAVMGQLTASFAHEIGTPLNAIGGHLQLLREDWLTGPQQTQTTEAGERFEVINGQVNKIEQIVKGFLQSTSKPNSQKQLVDLNRLVDQTLGIVGPRVDSLGIEVRRLLDRQIGPLRAVPLELEQILLNLMNNSLDSIEAKSAGRERGHRQLEVATKVAQDAGKYWAVLTVYDTGEGISKADLPNVLKPFFTTKRPGEGTGLGLTICQELARKYGGQLELESKEGAWTRVTLKIPYQTGTGTSI